MNEKGTKKTKYPQAVTPMFRASFANLFEARKADVNDATAKAKFSIVMLFKDKSKPEYAKDPEAVDITPLKQLVRNAVVEKFGIDTSKWPTKVVGKDPTTGKPVVVSALRLPFRDGAEKDYDGYGPGITFCSASSVHKPGVVDYKRDPIVVPSDFYSGCFARATVVAFYYSNKGNQGFSFGLRNVQKIKDGEPFSGHTKAENDFDALPMPEGSPEEMGKMPAEAGATAPAVEAAADPLFGN